MLITVSQMPLISASKVKSPYKPSSPQGRGVSHFQVVWRN